MTKLKYKKPLKCDDEDFTQLLVKLAALLAPLDVNITETQE